MVARQHPIIRAWTVEVDECIFTAAPLFRLYVNHPTDVCHVFASVAVGWICHYIQLMLFGWITVVYMDYCCFDGLLLSGNIFLIEYSMLYSVGSLIYGFILYVVKRSFIAGALSLEQQ